MFNNIDTSFLIGILIGLVSLIILMIVAAVVVPVLMLDFYGYQEIDSLAFSH